MFKDILIFSLPKPWNQPEFDFFFTKACQMLTSTIKNLENQVNIEI